MIRMAFFSQGTSMMIWTSGKGWSRRIKRRVPIPSSQAKDLKRRNGAPELFGHSMNLLHRGERRTLCVLHQFTIHLTKYKNAMLKASTHAPIAILDTIEER